MDNVAENDVMALYDALLHNDLDSARRMLEAGVNVSRECSEPQSEPPLHLATRMGNLPAVQLLLEYGADVSIRHMSQSGEATALLIAIKTNCSSSYEICKLLLENGANCHERQRLARPPVLHALRFSNMKIVQLLIDHGADIRAVDPDGRMALHYAVINHNNPNVLLFLLDQGLDIEGSTIVGDGNEDSTPLHYAAAAGNLVGCRILLERGAMVNRKCSFRGATPLSMAIEFNVEPHVVRLLLDYGAEVAHKIEGQSILELAAAERVSDGVRNVLIQHVAKIKFNFKVSEEDQLTIENKDCYREYYQSCLREIKMMGEARFYNNVTIFSIFMASEKLISGYARNEELIQALEENDYEHIFPIYFASLRKRFCTVVEKQKSYILAATRLNTIFNFNEPLHLINKKILSYLNDEEWTFLEM